MIEYTANIHNISEEMLDGGFFDGWPSPPSPSAHLRIMQGSYAVWLAVDTDTNKVVGFITAVSDGVISAYIPLLEVIPEYKNKGIGKELVSRMLNSLKGLYMVDLLCDKDMQSFYAKFGMSNSTGSFLRNYDRQNCEENQNFDCGEGI